MPRQPDPAWQAEASLVRALLGQMIRAANIENKINWDQVEQDARLGIDPSLRPHIKQVIRGIQDHAAASRPFNPLGNPLDVF